MIWFKIKKLENKIAKSELSDKEGLNYFIAGSIMSIIALSIVAFTKSIICENNWLTLLNIIVSIIILIVGMKIIFSLNEKIDGKDFFKRYFSIFWVLTIIILTITMIISVLLGIAIGVFGNEDTINKFYFYYGNDIFKIIFNAFFSIILYILIINSFRRIENKIKNSTQQPL